MLIASQPSVHPVTQQTSKWPGAANRIIRAALIMGGILIVFAIFFPALYIELPFALRVKNGIVLTQENHETLRLKYATDKSSYLVGTHPTMRRWRWYFIDVDFPYRDFPPRSEQSHQWIFRYDDQLGTAFVEYVNPRLDNPEERIYAIRSVKRENRNEAEKLAGESYIYFGYAIRSLEDLKWLRDALGNVPDFDPEQNVRTSDGTLFRLRRGVEHSLATDPNDESELARIRAEIPVLVERANAAAGHPMDTVDVLYLDGTIAEIPFGTRFPADMETLRILFPYDY